LWKSWQGPAVETLETCAILTTGANDLVLPIHNRMPVIVPADAHARWLDPDAQDPAAVADLLAPYPVGGWRLRP
jgi:putative SOS response-associated peptidase YedK